MKNKIEVTLEKKGHIEISLFFPFMRIVCPRCNGDGHHSNPAIDGNGLSDDHVNDVDFMEDYLSGAYDVICEECRGKKILEVVDEHFLERIEKTHPRIFAAYWRKIESVQRYEAEEAAHRRSIESGRGGW